MRAKVDVPRTIASAPPDASQVFSDLLAAVREAPDRVARLAADPYLQQLVVQAFVEAELARLFEERNRRLAVSEVPLTYERAQAQLQAGQAMRTALAVTRDVLGPYALLSADDPRAPAGSAFAGYELAALDGPSPDAQKAEMAAALGYPAAGERGAQQPTTADTRDEAPTVGRRRWT